MYKFLTRIGAPRWHQMTGSAVRVHGAVAAAAVLATAATSVGFSDRLHPLVSPIVFYAANPALLSPPPSSLVSFSASARPFPSRPSSLLPSCGKLLEDSCASPSFLLTNGASNVLGTSSMYSVEKVLSTPQMKYLSTKGGPLFSSTPTILFSSSHLWRDQRQGLQAVTASSSATLVLSSSTPSPSSPEILPSFDTFGLPSHLAKILSSLTSSPTHPHPTTISSKSLHKWHAPAPGVVNDDKDGSSASSKPGLTVVLLGWLGSQQKHLKKYAEWYNARGIDAVTFTLPMADVLSLSVGGKAEEHVGNLTDQLSELLAKDSNKGGKCPDRQLIFHTFSNTGWLTYGVILENLSSTESDWADRIKGCVVDSAPAADLDPHVWACGFSAALLKKRSNAANGDLGFPNATNAAVVKTAQPHVAESALLALLEKFFSLFLRIPAVNQRLSEVVSVLSKQQPACPQLYIYSTADKVIPVSLVEKFMEKQRQQGRIVRGCNFQSSPHVDHFRTFPENYGKQVTNFLQECLLMSPSKTN